MLSDSELDLIAATGGRASASPEVEANMGHGPSAAGRLLHRGIPVGLSVDVCTNVGGDMFGAMRAALALERGRRNDQILHGEVPGKDSLLQTADILRMATAGGAQVLGMNSDVGTVEVGKRADLDRHPA